MAELRSPGAARRALMAELRSANPKYALSTSATFGAVVPPPESPFSTTIATAIRGASLGA